MAKKSDITVRQFLHGLFGRGFLGQLCRETGFRRRRSKIVPEQFLLCMILHVASNLQRVLDQFVLSFGTSVVRSSFYERTSSPGLHRAVSRLLEHLQRRAKSRALPARVRRAMGEFADIVALDSTVLVLRDQLEPYLRGTRKQYRAAAKVFTAVRVLTGELLHHKIASERTNEVKMVSGFALSARRLYLLDMGFSAVWLWQQFIRADAYFLTRLRTNFRPVICSGRHEGAAVREVLRRRDMRRNAEFWCHFSVRKRPWATKTGEQIRLRVVALYDADSNKHWLYVTNASRVLLPRSRVRKLYALRWQIELNYKLAKGHFGLKNIASTNPDVVRCLIQAALSRCSIAMQAKHLADAELPKGRWSNVLRWAVVWAAALPFALAGRRLHFKQLATIAADPNRKRIPACQQAFPQLIATA